MTNSVSRCLLILLPTLLLGCASSPPKPVVDFNPQYDFSGIERIGFYSESGQVSGDNPLQLSDIQIGRIDRALATAMRNKGLTVVDDPAEAQLLLSWHLATADKTDVRTYETPAYGGYYPGMGHPYNRYSRYSCWSCMPTRTEVSVQNYTEGTFIIDLIDPKLEKSVWRSVVQSRLKGKPLENQSEYDAAAARLLAAFPPA